MKLMNKTEDMKRSWLVQRLEAPAKNPGRFKDNPFSFGGGLVNGGMSPEAMDLIRDIFAFDYMGAAEFEWGAVPKALQKIAEHGKRYRATVFSLGDNADQPIYVIAHRDHEVEVRSRIQEWATGKEDLKGRTWLRNAINPSSEYDSRIKGWLELDNGFMFFVDRDMWLKTAALFDLPT